MPDPCCPPLQTAVRNLEGAFRELGEAFQEGVQSGDFSVFKRVREEFKKRRQKEFEDYRKRVKKVIEKFLKKIRRKWKGMEGIEFEIDYQDWLVILKGNLNFENPKTSELPKKLRIPRVIKKITGDLRLPQARSVYFPLLKEVGGVVAVPNAESVDLRRLKRVGRDFYAPKAHSVNLSQLERIGGVLRAPNAQVLNVSRLQEAEGGIVAPEVQFLNSPSLKRMGSWSEKIIEIVGSKTWELSFSVSLLAGSLQAWEASHIEKINGNLLFTQPPSSQVRAQLREWREKGILEKGAVVVKWNKEKEGWQIEQVLEV